MALQFQDCFHNPCAMLLPTSHHTNMGKYCLCMVSLSTLPTTLEGNQPSNIWFSSGSLFCVCLRLLNHWYKQVVWLVERKMLPVLTQRTQQG